MARDPRRRYTDSEVTEIFERAADAEHSRKAPTGPREGLTLPELQRIGEEVGLSSELIADAAGAIDRRGSGPEKKRYIGIPVGVSRTVPLERPLTDGEWGRIVSLSRDEFAARGRMRSDGTLREWSNGNLHVLVEPGADGWELRMGTRKSDGQGILAMGGMFSIVGLVLVVLAVLGVMADPDALQMGSFFALFGLAQVAWSALRLPPWARERERQFERLGREAQRLAAVPPSGESEKG